MAEPMSDLVRVENLAIDFDTDHGKVAALRGVSFALPAGEVLGIVGESGSGKTVACRAILKLLAGNATVASGRISSGNVSPTSSFISLLSGISASYSTASTSICA